MTLYVLRFIYFPLLPLLIEPIPIFSGLKKVIKQEADRATVRLIAKKARSLLSGNLCDKIWITI